MTKENKEEQLLTICREIYEHKGTWGTGYRRIIKLLKEPMSLNKDWKKRFGEEFGIHFKDSSGELKFAITFIEELLDQARQEYKQTLIKKIEGKKIKYRDRRNGPYNEGNVNGYNDALNDIKKLIEEL